MVDPADVPLVVFDAAKLAREGEMIVFGSAALALWLDHGPFTEDVDMILHPSEAGDPVEAVMGELSWYHDKHGVYVQVVPPHVFAAPETWPSRAIRRRLSHAEGVELVVPHPHDILLSKVERWAEKDREHARLILDQLPLSSDALEALAAQMPQRTPTCTDEGRRRRFEANLARLRQLVGA